MSPGCCCWIVAKTEPAWRAGWLPAHAHDALNRLLRVHPVSTRAWMGGLIQWTRGLGQGYLVVDDVVVSKPFSKQSRWVGWTYSTSEKRRVGGFHVVVLPGIAPSPNWPGK